MNNPEAIDINLSESEPDFQRLCQKLNGYISEPRMQHVLRVVQTAAELCCHHGLAMLLPQVKFSALLHDCAKELPLETMHVYAQYACSDAHPYKELAEASEAVAAHATNGNLLHAVAGAGVAIKEFGQSDEALLLGILHHTVGRPMMGPVEQLVYLADMIEPGRDFPGVEELRDIAYNNLNHALRQTLKVSMDHLIQRGISPHPISRAAYAYYRDSNDNKGSESL
jgi:predicted HD superfamily hydrolase involved in NAD metabolism